MGPEGPPTKAQALTAAPAKKIGR
ncbi:hypothetical protein [Lysobacter gummosus]